MTAELNLSADYRKNRVIIDGHDLTNHITGLTLTAEAGRMPRLNIDLRVIDITAMGDEYTTLRIDLGTVDLLKRCGWTAPDGDPTLLRPREEDQT